MQHVTAYFYSGTTSLIKAEKMGDVFEFACVLLAMGV